MEQDKSNWWEWDGEKFTFQQTIDHVFAKYHNGGKRIGDMDRDELIHVIATGQHDREALAFALLSAIGERNTNKFELDDAVSLAKKIAENVRHNRLWA